jgi:hypothetical protein
MTEFYGRPVHIWTDEEIRALPTCHIWFYGLCLDEASGEMVLSEIHPSLGRSSFSIYEDDGDRKPVDKQEQWTDVGYDILNVNPEYLARKFPDAEKVDWDKEMAEAKPIDFEELFHDDRSLFLKLMDSRYLLDFFMDKPPFVSRVEIEEDFEDYEDDLANLLSFEIIKKQEDGIYYLNHENKLTKMFIHLDAMLSKYGSELIGNIRQGTD